MEGAAVFGDKLSLEKIAGKDLGVIARARISRGERVFAEAPLFNVRRQLLPLDKGVGRKHAEAEVRKIVKKLPEDGRKAFWAMHDCYAVSGNKSAIGICRTNNFALNATPNTLGCFPFGGRFNHSCRPNLVWYWSEQPGSKLVFHATKDIEVGEELCISYCTLEDSTAKRKARLKESHSFVCRCEVCTLTGPALEKSNRLRSEYRELTRTAQETAAHEPRMALQALDRIFEIIDEEFGGELWMRSRAKNDAFHAAIFGKDLQLASQAMTDAIHAWVNAGGESDQALLTKMRGYAADPTTHRLWCLGARKIWSGARVLRRRAAAELEA